MLGGQATPRNGQSVTLTYRRGEMDITVEMQWYDDKWYVILSLDEMGNSVALTSLEKANIKARARQGEDEAGQ
jgi:hypothetical protein